VIILKRKIAHKHKTARLTSRSWPSPFHNAHSSPETKIRSAQTSECSPVTTCPCNLNRWWPGLAIVVRSYRSNKNREPAAPQNPKPPFQFIPFISHLQQEREREREREPKRWWPDQIWDGGVVVDPLIGAHALSRRSVPPSSRSMVASLGGPRWPNNDKSAIGGDGRSTSQSPIASNPAVRLKSGRSYGGFEAWHQQVAPAVRSPS
jgi:hypothetical protein